ncbi:MAG: Ig-like domain-containing protein, partial [Bacteroidetes bacterium]|nr:Ig-like domain-containing protein [Bacteroidota bacterium]
TIDNAGMITALTAGTTTIKYIVSNGSGCIDSVSKTITINDNPVVTAITAAPSVCVGSKITASNITANGVWATGNAALVTIDASGLVTGVAAGSTTITYSVTDAITTCSATISSPLTVNTPAVAPITGVNALCPASTSTLSTTTTGGVWSSSDAAVATVDVNGLVTAIANGVATITYKVPVGNACGDSASTIVTVNTTLVIEPITGDSTVCVGSQSTLASLTLGGTWTSSNTAVATIDATTGVVTTVSSGTTTITYSVTSGAGCSNSSTTTFTVDSLPSTPDFAMNPSVCVGGAEKLIATISGGVWSSSNSSVASVDASGNLSAVSVGTANITYTLTNAAGCSTFVTKSITINALPVIAAISGNNTVCLGASIALTNDSTGGVWNSNNTAVLTIDASGVITTVAAGNTTVDYIITNANGCSNKVSKTITVFDLPTVATITGGNNVCVGSSITLSSATPNGVWSSVTPFVASITNAGVVTGNFFGGTTIKYTVTNAVTTCSNSASLVITVNALPNVPAITGASSVCLNATTTLANTTASGTWSSSNASVATIDNAGVVTGVGAGTSTITYNVTNASNCNASVTSSITVNVATASTANASVCNNMLPYNWNGSNYSAAGTYTFSTTNANGCDSIATLVLTVKDTTTSSTSISVCNSYIWNGNAYTTSGTYTWKGTNAAGCDSIATLILTINNGTHNTTTQTACDSLVWNGTTYTTSGTYTYSYNNSNGCASVDTLYLTINNGTHNTSTQTSCDSLVWNGTTYTTSGIYTYSYSNSNGCASVDTLYLTI